ncbi:hypothetical protein V6N13_081421 [Hibiscus sabdariffa]
MTGFGEIFVTKGGYGQYTSVSVTLLARALHYGFTGYTECDWTGKAIIFGRAAVESCVVQLFIPFRSGDWSLGCRGGRAKKLY